MFDTTIDKLNRLKKYIKQTEDNVKMMINCMKTIMNAQKQFSFVSKDAKLKGDEVVLKQKLNLVSDFIFKFKF